VAGDAFDAFAGVAHVGEFDHVASVWHRSITVVENGGGESCRSV
jgi:hypothetical protein